MKLMKITKITLGLMILLSVNFSFSQQDAQFTQYMYNTGTINPAYAGSRGLLSLTGIYRNQWVGIQGAPETMSFSLNSPIGSKGVGMGLSFLSDKVGPSVESNITADFSYTISVSPATRLSFGLKGGYNFLDLDVEKLNIYDPNDENLFSKNIKSPVAGVGIYLHNEQWYLGISSPNILETEHYDEVAVSTAKEKAHFYFIGGYVFDLADEWKFKPAVMAKMVTGAPLSVDLSANFQYRETFTLGAAYRYDAAFSALAGFQVTDKILLGYAYDFDTSELALYHSGTHEIFLRLELPNRAGIYKSPRFF